MDASLKNLTPLDRQLVTWILSAFPLDAPQTLPNPADDVTWRALLERSTLQGTNPLLYLALETRSFVNVPAFVVETLRDIYRRSALSNATAHRELEIICAHLTAQALEAIVLKGAALSKWLYPQAAMRPFNDLDLLIQPADRPAVSAILNQCDYTETNFATTDFHNAFYCETLFTRAQLPRQSVDLHWHLLNAQFYRRRIKPEWFWERTQLATLGSAAFRLFDPTAQFAHLALHLSVHHGNIPRLIQLYDIALLIHKHDDTIDWEAVARYVQDAGLAHPVYYALERTCAAWQFASSPRILTLFRPRVWHISQRLTFQFFIATHREGAVLSDALDLPGAKNKLRYALRHLFPDPAYMRQRYTLASDAFLPYYYLKRLAASAWKFARSVWSAFLH